MDDYIKRNDAIEAMQNYMIEKAQTFPKRKNRIFAMRLDLYSVLVKIPSADIRENVRGEWEILDDKMPEPDGEWVRCSVCRCSEHLEYNHANLTWNFCPNCGADMRMEVKKR